MEMENPFPFPFQVPQQRRNKLQFVPLPLQNDHQLPASPAASALNLSLSTEAARGGGGGGGGYSAYTPVGPFTGYSSILGRSRFLRPAQELLEGLSSAPGGTEATKKILEESGSWFISDDDDHLSRHCTNPNLLSMLHQVYKKYKLYCQQMQSAVTSFESVAGLANAAPFISFAVRAMFRHFHCLKNAIIDQIRVSSSSSKGSGGVDFGRERDSGSCPCPDQDRSQNEHNQGHVTASGSNLLQHPVWRSQRGFPDKAVAVLRTWLFDHFLHPYPSDSDKQMLAQKTGLSRSQVSNWFTNARVRLWKPMVEEMHALERKAQCSKSTDPSKFINLSSDSNHDLSECHRDHESQSSKRSRIEEISRAEQSKEQFGIPCSHLMPSNQLITGELTHSPAIMASHQQQNTSGLSWSPQAQIIPFWLARQ